MLGWMNATWPLATLTVSPGGLVLAVFPLGTVRLSPEEVTSVEPFRLLPFLAEGVRIRHTSGSLPDLVIFWYFFGRKALAREVMQCLGGTKKPASNEGLDFA